MLRAKRWATVVFYLLTPLRTLRLCGEKQVSNLSILGNVAHFRHFIY